MFHTFTFNIERKSNLKSIKYRDVRPTVGREDLDPPILIISPSKKND